MKTSFEWQVKADGIPVEFSFARVFTTSGIRYFVTVIDRDNKPYLFHMEKRNGWWKIIDAPKVPQWIHDVESELGNAIIANSR